MREAYGARGRRCGAHYLVQVSLTPPEMPKFTNKRRVNHSAEQMFDLVADVERYPEFVPMCQSLKVRQRTAGTERHRDDRLPT